MRKIKQRPGSIYAVIFDNGMMKVGMSYGSVKGRVDQHKQKARIVGASISSEYSVVALSNPMGCEFELINFCKRKFNQLEVFGREWFDGLSKGDFAEVRNHMDEISAQSNAIAHGCPTPEQVNAEVRLDEFINDGFKAIDERNSYASALCMARVMQRMVENEMISSEIFMSRPELKGLSPFLLAMSIYLTSLNEDQMAQCFMDISSGVMDEDCDLVFVTYSAAQSYVKQLTDAMQD